MATASSQAKATASSQALVARPAAKPSHGHQQAADQPRQQRRFFLSVTEAYRQKTEGQKGYFRNKYMYLDEEID
jgi:hypothetical protein